MYYQTLARTFPQINATSPFGQWKIPAPRSEPEFFEPCGLFTYQFTGEQLWIARVYSSLFFGSCGAVLF